MFSFVQLFYAKTLLVEPPALGTALPFPFSDGDYDGAYFAAYIFADFSIGFAALCNKAVTISGEATQRVHWCARTARQVLTAY